MRGREGERWKERERKRERVCVCVCVFGTTEKLEYSVHQPS